MLNFAGRQITKRCLHASLPQRAVTTMEMPAMSPTMTEGGISSWKKNQGERFSAGDVLLEIETDKATIDVEAQDDGVMGKILLPAGSKNIPVGNVIALLAEEGDDISNLQVPKDHPSTPKPPSTPTPAQQLEPEAPSIQPLSHAPSHIRPLFPSVLRLLVEGGVSDTSKIKGTGVRGMLTKGDVLAYLGKASSPLGTYKAPKIEHVPTTPLASRPVEENKPVVQSLDGPALRRLIVNNMLRNSVKARTAALGPQSPATFDSLVEDYLGPGRPASKSTMAKKSTEDYFEGLL